MIRWCDQHVVVVFFSGQNGYSIPNSTLLASPGDAVSARPRRSIFHGVSPVLAFASAPPEASLPPTLLLGPAHPPSPILCAGPASVLYHHQSRLTSVYSIPFRSVARFFISYVCGYFGLLGFLGRALGAGRGCTVHVCCRVITTWLGGYVLLVCLLACVCV